MRCPIRWHSIPNRPDFCSVSTKKGLWEEHLSRFRGKEVNQEAVIGGRVCRIDEAEEPSDVIWENIDTSIFQRCRR